MALESDSEKNLLSTEVVEGNLSKVLACVQDVWHRKKRVRTPVVLLCLLLVKYSW